MDGNGVCVRVFFRLMTFCRLRFSGKFEPLLTYSRPNVIGEGKNCCSTEPLVPQRRSANFNKERKGEDLIK